MRQPKFNIGFAHFAYGGNGGISSETPDIREWQVPLVAEIARDERVEDIRIFNVSDTPITMSRNQAVIRAREMGVDILVMVDSDMKPDMYAGAEGVKPFFQSSFDYLTEHYHKGPVCIGAPYCGPPPNENVYVFRWQTQQSEHPNPDFQLEFLDRDTAAKMSGIQPCAALPTGLIMFDMRLFDIIEPEDAADKPFFYYEWTDKYASHKASTEDVTNTRDMSLICERQLGYNPILCNWDAWAGHWKPKCVGKPIVMDSAGVSKKMQRAILRGDEPGTKIIDLKMPPGLQEKIDGEFNGMGMELPQDDVSAIDAMIREFRKVYGRRPTVLEVGSWAGRSAIAMVKAGAESVHCVDHWQGNRYDSGTSGYDWSAGTPREVFLRNTKDLPISSTVGESPSIAAAFPEKSYDIVYIDAEHTGEAVTRDIAAWAPKATHWVCGHDYHVFPAVKQAVDAAFPEVRVEANVWKALSKDLYTVS